MRLQTISDNFHRQKVQYFVYQDMRIEPLTAEEVSKLTGLSIGTLAQWRSQKRNIPYLKIGRLVRYSQRDVQVYLDSCRVSVNERRQK